MRITMILLLLACSFIGYGQSDSLHNHRAKANTDTIPPYLRIPYLPTFSIQTPDSSWFSKSQLQENKPVLLLYFSPDCGHCMIETEEMIGKMNSLKNLQIVMATSREFDEMKKFADHYKLERFRNVRIGRDAQRTITRFYRVKFTPFSALYDKKGNFLKAYEKGIDWEELLRLVK
ncbi:peroxiredoxin family protein [Aridibaculum aurantiacum]|uniref:peroxiredoxin family protein n=1 Tax=Aridibaculum aurantiacum TaxID=2810307 RepID=UPI001A974DBD|nr:redoxin domain-containing protein [Aridibaculum aurantiacum]